MKVSPAWSDTFYFWPIPFYFDLYTFSFDAKAQKKDIHRGMSFF